MSDSRTPDPHTGETPETAPGHAPAASGYAPGATPAAPPIPPAPAHDSTPSSPTPPPVAPSPATTGYGAQGYSGSAGYPAPAYGNAVATVRTNVLAIISLVASLSGFILFPVIGPIAGVITGHISLAQLKTSGEQGRGLALAGVIIGWVSIGFAVLIIAIALIITVIAIGASASMYRS